jgi:hypothetical protein
LLLFGLDGVEVSFDLVLAEQARDRLRGLGERSSGCGVEERSGVLQPVPAWLLGCLD